jgi:hypothetical protein
MAINQMTYGASMLEITNGISLRSEVILVLIFLTFLHRLYLQLLLLSQFKNKNRNLKMMELKDLAKE